MINKLRALFTRSSAPVLAAEVPAGQRVYAVGDIHGRRDLFDELIAMVEADDAARGPADTTIVLLGDLVDRGPDSAGVIAAARDLGRRRAVRTIAGNHEEMFIGSFKRDEVLRHFLLHGGKETLLSYPIEREEYDRATLGELRKLMPGFVPAEDMEFIAAMEDQVLIGDYLFVHAGIRPGVPLDQQHKADLRWIRSEFLEDRTDHGCIVVHGHTITDDVVQRANRIGIDTGAYASGRLTAVGLEGAGRWFLSTEPPPAGDDDDGDENEMPGGL